MANALEFSSHKVKALFTSYLLIEHISKEDKC